MEMFYLFGCSCMNCTLLELTGGQKEKVKLFGGGKKESDGGRGDGREGRNAKGGGGLCSHLPLCQQLVTVATSKKSLSLIDTVAGSGVFNCIISFFFSLSAVTHSSLAVVLHFILGLHFFPPVSSFLLVCCVPFF